MLLQKCDQWGLPCSVLQADVSKAFDSMDHDELVESLRFSRTPEGLIHAVLSELSHNEVEIHLADICATSRVLLNCGGKQGGSDTPGLWNRYLDSAWQKAEKRFVLENLGFCMEMFDGTFRTIRGQFWADDIYLYGCSVDMCSRMFAILTEEIQALKLSWKLHSIQILDSTAVGALPCELQGINSCGTFSISSRMCLDILGTRVDRTGSTKCTMNHRASKLFVSWSQVRSQFCSRRVTLALRLREFFEVLGRAFLFNCGGWTVNGLVAAKIGVWERNLLRQMLCRHKTEGETWHDFNMRVDLKLNAALKQLKIMPLSLQCCVAYFGWAGHMARMPSHSYLRMVLSWRDMFWWGTVQHLGVDGVGSPRPVMRRPGAPIRWEEAVSKHVGVNWAVECLDRAVWAARKFSLAAKRWCDLLARVHCPAGEWTPLAHIAPTMQHSCPCVNLAKVGLLFCVDNLQVSQQINGFWEVSGQYKPVVRRAQWLLHCIRANTRLGFWDNWPLSVHHRTREHNVEADTMANLALDCGDHQEFRHETLQPGDRILVTSDGASRVNPGPSSVACAVFLFRAGGVPKLLAHVGRKTEDTTNVRAEFDSILLAMKVLCDWISRHVRGLAHNSNAKLGTAIP